MYTPRTCTHTHTSTPTHDIRTHTHTSILACASMTFLCRSRDLCEAWSCWSVRASILPRVSLSSFSWMVYSMERCILSHFWYSLNSSFSSSNSPRRSSMLSSSSVIWVRLDSTGGREGEGRGKGGGGEGRGGTQSQLLELRRLLKIVKNRHPMCADIPAHVD